MTQIIKLIDSEMIVAKLKISYLEAEKITKLENFPKKRYANLYGRDYWKYDEVMEFIKNEYRKK
jgi:hypothetical protein